MEKPPQPAPRPRFGHEAFAARQARTNRAIETLQTSDIPCPKCRQSLLGIPQLLCPECGEPIPTDWVNPSTAPMNPWVAPAWLKPWGCAMFAAVVYITAVLLTPQLGLAPAPLVIGAVFTGCTIHLAYLCIHELEPEKSRVRPGWITYRRQRRQGTDRWTRHSRIAMWLATYALTPVCVILSAFL